MSNDGRKYILTDETLKKGDITLYRIKAVRSFGEVNAGDLGGFIQSEDNLDHNGLAWVHDDSIVMNNARVSDNARVRGNCLVAFNAKISHWGLVTNTAYVGNNAVVTGHGRVMGNAMVFGDAVVRGYSVVMDKANVYGESNICGHCVVYGQCAIVGKSVVSGNAQVYGNAKLCDCIINDGSRVYGDVSLTDIHLFGSANVNDDNVVKKWETDEGAVVTTYVLDTGKRVVIENNDPTTQKFGDLYRVGNGQYVVMV